jgi:Tfp pilus assembly protein PilO
MGKNLTKEQQMLIVAIVFAGIIVWGYWTQLISPLLSDIKVKSEKLQGLQAQVEQAQRQAAQFPILSAQYEKVKAEVAQIEKQLPRDQDVPSILRLITQQALDHNIHFVSLRPLDPKSETLFNVIEFEVAVTGGLSAFARFVAAIGQQERIFQVEQVKMTLISQTEPTVEPNLNINFQLKTFAYAG